MKNLTFLSVKRNQISDIRHLKSLINLRQVFLSDNKITDISSLISLKNLTNPLGLDVSRNQIINKTCPFDDKEICSF